MQKSSSRRSNRTDANGVVVKNSSSYSEPPSGVYSSDDDDSEVSYSSTTHKRVTKKTTVEEKYLDHNNNDSEYDSTEEYQVSFPTVELKLPRHRHHHHHHRSRGREHVTIARNVDRRHVYGESDCKDSLSEYTTYTYSTSNPNRSELQSPDVRSDRTAVSQASSHPSSYQTYASTHRLQSIGNFFTSIFEFFRTNPKITKFIFGITMCYVVVCNLEVLIPRVIAIFVRLCYPWARYSAVVAEQFFSTFANMFTRLDAVIYASYCEFAAKYCRSRRLMCDVTCSFVDHVLSQARPNLAPIPHN